MKKCVTLLSVCSLVLVLAPLTAQALNMGVGSNFLGYQKANLEVGLGLNSELSPNDLELELGAAVAIDLDRSSGTLVPKFLVPAHLGFNFLYPLSEAKSAKPATLYGFTYFFGLGAAPQVSFGLNFSDPQYYGGPYFQTGFRFKAHNYMTIQVQAEQELLFGGPDWISTNTRAGVSILLSWPPVPKK
ncbi:MAG: hypothetical protein WCG80_05585 [Spirochaetales bacterium]